MKPGSIWDNPEGIIRWLIESAKKDAVEMPFFPDRVVLMTVIKAVDNGEIEVPEDKKEAVAVAILQLKLDFGGKL